MQTRCTHGHAWSCAVLGRALLLALVLAGCDAEDDRPPLDPGPSDPPTGTLLGTLVKAEDGGALGSLEVSLFDLTSFAPVALTRSDSLGEFGFAGIDPGDYLPVVYANDRAPFGLPRARYSFTAGETLRVIIPLSPRVDERQTTLELRGQVLDAETDEPIALARVEMSAFESDVNWSEFRGHATTVEPITDHEGRFLLGPISTGLRYDQNSGLFVEVVPSWRVTAPGYRAASIHGRELADFVTDVVVRLVPGRDEGVITGRVVGVDGDPREGVRVHVEWRAESGQVLKGEALERLIPNDASAVSDAVGRFRFEGLPGGRFNLLAGALPDDGWVGIAKTGVEIKGDSLLARAGDLIAVPAITLLSPGEGEQVVGSHSLRWQPVPEAVFYRVVVRRALDLGVLSYTVEGPVIEIGPGPPPYDVPSLFRWSIVALDAQGREIAATDRAYLFRYDPGVRTGTH